jgi:Kef-type K+ transport systems, membrane components
MMRLLSLRTVAGLRRLNPRSSLAVAIAVVVPLSVIGIVVARFTHHGSLAGSTAPPTEGMGTAGHFLLAAAVVLLAAYLGGALAVRLGQPQVIGEICVGLALGPSLLGRVAPGALDWLFSAQTRPLLDGLAQLGLVLFMFGVGRELSGMRPRGTAMQAVLVSQASMFVPFAGGTLAALFLVEDHLGSQKHPLAFVLFLGCVLSITAFPVLARILADLGITRTEVGKLSLFSAAVGDAGTWLLLAVILAGLHGSDHTGLIIDILALCAITAVLLGPGRRLMARWPEAEDRGPGADTAAVMLVVGVAACSALTAAVGVHQVIGALLAGIAWPVGHRRAAMVAERMAAFANITLLPFFFFGFGLTTDLGVLQLDMPTMTAFGALLFLAATSKIAGPSVCARLTGTPWRPALALGVLLNARGLTELVVIQIGYQAGVIDEPMVAVLTLVALVTTIITSPLLRLLGSQAIPRTQQDTVVAGNSPVAGGRSEAPVPQQQNADH